MSGLKDCSIQILISRIKDSGATSYATQSAYAETVFDKEILSRFTELERENADLRNQVEQGKKAVEAMESIVSWNKDHAANRLYDSMFISVIQGPINAYQQSAKEEGK